MPAQLPLLVQGFTESRFPRALDALKRGVGEGAAPGFVAGLWSAREPDIAWIAAHGQRRIVPSPQPLSTDTPYDISSVSKVYCTAALAATLIARGWLDWDTPVRALLPELKLHSGGEEILIRHLLSHTAGYAAWAPLWERLRERFVGRPVERYPIALRQKAAREQVLSTAPEAPPESRALYSDLSFLVLGFALEELTGLPLDVAVERFVWQPLGARGSFYRHVTRSQSAPRARLERAAATEDSQWRGGVLQGQVHDDNCWAMGGYGGHAGAFATAEDLLGFARALWTGFLPAGVRDRMWKRVDRPAGCDRTPGWDTPSSQGSMVGNRFSRNSVGHWGYTGTSLWIDLDAGIAVTLLSNRVHPTRQNEKIREFRPVFHDAIREDFEG